MSATGVPRAQPAGPLSLGAETQGGARCVVEVTGDAVVVCTGELDVATRPGLRRALQRAQRLLPDRVVVDLDGVSFFSASAITEFVRARAASLDAGGEFILRSPSPFGRRVLDIVGLTHLIESVPGEATAVDVARRVDEWAAAWERACATSRYGAAALAFDPTVVLSELAGLLGTPGPVAAAGLATHLGDREAGDAGDCPVSARAVLQLWALNDVLHDWIDSHGGGALGHERQVRQRVEVESALAAMVTAVLAELEQATLLDPLTGLLNRRAFDRDVLQALAAARRHGHHLSLVMVDVLGLKDVNDQLGHAAGDDLLRGVATNLASRLRTGDNAYRLGGDEFVLVLPELRPDDIDVVMDRAVVGAEGAFTWGCAWVKGDEDDAATDQERAVALLAAADQRMLAYRSQTEDHSGGWVHQTAESAGAVGDDTLKLAGEFAAGYRASVLVEEAKGLIAEHLGISVDEALIVLQRFAATQPHTLVATAAGLMDHTIGLAQLAQLHTASSPVDGATSRGAPGARER
jgi:anti-anti-sigma factor